MADRYAKDILALVSKIRSHSKKKGSRTPALLDNFIQHFFVEGSKDYLESRPAEKHRQCALDTLEFISKIPSKTSQKVRVSSPSWNLERTVIQICSRDVPFLIDSTTAEINRHGLHVYELLHPVLTMTRDAQGNLKSIGVDTATKKGRVESIIYFETSYIAEESERKRLEEDLNQVIKAVHHSVEDWRTMLGKIGETTDYINKSQLPFTTDYLAEVRGFFKWLADNHFTFLGYGRYEVKNNQYKISNKADERLGLFKFEPDNKGKQHEETVPSAPVTRSQDQVVIEFSKSGKPSLVHRPVHMDYIRVKELTRDGELIGERRFLGLFTSSVYYQSATLIPIIRKKIDSVLKRAGFKPNSHNGKELVTILETYPRDELFQIDENQLFDICMEILELNKRPKLRMFIRRDIFERFLSCIIFIPRERFNTQLRQKIQVVLQEEFGGDAGDYYTQVTDSALARLHVIVKTKAAKVKQADIARTERRLLEITNSWTDGLRDTLLQNMGERDGEYLFQGYADAFPASYTSRYHFGGTYRDIKKIEEALKKSTLTLDLYRLHIDKKKIFQLKIFNPETQVTLSNILPILENMGFHVVDELTFLVSPLGKKKAWVHHFHLEVDVNADVLNKQDERSYAESIKAEFEAAFLKIWQQELEDDTLNTLIVKAEMKWRDVMLLRAYAKYLKQAEFHYNYYYTTEALPKHPILSRKLIQLFNAQFDPSLSKKEREKTIEAIQRSIEHSLHTVTNVSEDRIIRQFLDVIKATLRTNYFQKDKDGNVKPYISFKLDSKRVPDLPKPVPFREIFVYSHDMEGIHLRGGKVARGGLRWSDRAEDFRTEILGLVKAQMVKNAVIVPVGSKGGFIIRRPVASDNRDAVMAQGISCYKTFLRGLLDITDNIVKGKIVAPKEVVRHDEDDPYLVVAADKGTATFSDTANGLSAEYGFWLGDAFASGGSQGYDHKKMGITAKGAWVAVSRHFMEMGIDVQKDEFTVIGIGGMSGDVFGNGMLLSRKIKLIAAFGHTNIFIDPHPDPEKTYKERERMFKLPRSTWEDYDQSTISKGGGIFNKKAKSIPISKEMKEVFDITENTLTPDQLLKKILLARVDLLWNGGIGTYIKAERESNDRVGDRANDSIRINGKDLRAKVVGEGGNLGMTQLGRVEYASKGGRLNTDFIDNSAGVDCSDHEVNIKIAFGLAMEKKKLTLERRNGLLSSMTDEVAELVIRDNRLQTQAITISQLQGHTLLESQIRVLKHLEQLHLLDRRIEFLPDDEALLQRHALDQGLTRPELSVLMCYSKMALYNDLINSNLPDDPYFSTDLKLYFPKPMRGKFETEIENHPLRREIVATAIANSIVNRVGSEFFFLIRENTGMKGCDVARAYTIARDAFDARALWTEIEKLDGVIDVKAQVGLFAEIKEFIERMTLWFLRNAKHPLNVAEVSDFAPAIEDLTQHLQKIMSPVLKEMVANKYQHYTGLGVPHALAQRIAYLLPLASSCDIVKVARHSKLPIRIVGEVYYALGTRLSLGWLRMWAERAPADTYWEKMSTQTLLNNFFDLQRRLAAEVTKATCKDDVCDAALEIWAEIPEVARKLERYDRFIDDLRSYEKIDMPKLVVAMKRVEAMCSE